MSFASPSTLIRRAAALPMGFLDLLDSGLDTGFSKVDRAVDRRIIAVTVRTASISQGLTRSSIALDRALDQRVTGFDAFSAIHVANTKAAASVAGALSANLAAHTDAKLNRSLHTFDRATAASIRMAIAFLNAGVALTHRTDNKISRGFNRVDVRATNVVNRAHNRRVKTTNLGVRITARIDQRIEIDFLRADARVNSGINRAVNVFEATQARAALVANATDVRFSNALARVDTRIDRRIEQGTRALAATLSVANTKSLAFERSLDRGISRIDSRITNGHTRAMATSAAAMRNVNALDNAIAVSVAHVDGRVNRRVQQLNRSYAVTYDFVADRLAATEAKLDSSVAAFDAQVATGVSRLMLAASAVAYFVQDHAEDIDNSLTQTLSTFDSKVDGFIDLVNGQPGRHSSQPRASLPWAATSLTLVLGTLGAATGASAVSASTVTNEIDNTVKIEASAAKDAVSQYLSVRETFQALQASRSRSIQTLEQEIAAAEARITQTGLSGRSIIDVANDYGGVPYVRGGTTPKGFDCSGYTKHVFAQLGVSLPRTSAQQYAWADKVSFDDRKVGDLMFWSNGGGVHHVAIYAGDGKMWDSPRPGRRVGKSTIWGSPTYGRVPTDAINASALEEIKTKKAELKKIKAEELNLEITVNPKFVLPSTDEN